MRPRARGAFVVVLALGACGAPAADRSAALPAAARGDSAPVPSLSVAWPEALGEVLALANTASGDALLFRRDTLAVPTAVAVVGYDSTVSTAIVREVRSQPCAARAMLRLADSPPGWMLAIDTASASRARPLAVDLLEELLPADSQRVAVRIQRALNALPDTGTALEFRGLPVVVRDAWLVHAPSGTLIVTRAARLRNLEATAHEELRFVVLENDQPRFVARVAGDEEVVESWDLLAALVVHGQTWLAVAREGAGTLQLELIVREAAAWRSVWRSDAIACRR